MQNITKTATHFTNIATALRREIKQMEELRSSGDDTCQQMEVVKKVAAIRARDWAWIIREIENLTESTPKYEEEPDGHMAVEARITELMSILRDLMAYTPWGANGSVFVTERSTSEFGDTSIRTLYLNGRGRVTLSFSNYPRKIGWVKIIPADEAEKVFQGKKELRRAKEERYQLFRARVIMSLLEEGHKSLSSFEGWTYSDGQEGGFFHRADEIWHETNCISAYGALRGAWGKDWKTNPINQEWSFWEEAPKTPEEKGNTLPHPVPVEEQTPADLKSADLSKLFGGAVRPSH